MREDVLRLLQQAEDYISGEAISIALGVTRTAVWKHIEALRSEGFLIDSLPRKGYRLLREGTALHPAQVEPLLLTDQLGRSLHIYKQVSSTNIVAKEMAAAGCPAGTAIVAEEQGAGRGRLGRSWANTPGLDICISFVLRPKIAPQHAPRFTLATALGVYHVAADIGANAAIKWPNDVLVDGKKICGILLEMSGNMDCLDAIIVGLGLNVNTDSFPHPLCDTATSLRIALERSFRRPDVLAALLNTLEPLYSACETDTGFEDVLADYRAHCSTIGSPVSIQGLNSVVYGIAEGVDTVGRLLLRTEDGTLQAFSSGDVSLRPPERKELL